MNTEHTPTATPLEPLVGHDLDDFVFNPFKDLVGKTIEATDYLGGTVNMKFTDNTSARIEFVVPTDRISFKELAEYQKRGICILSCGITLASRD